MNTILYIARLLGVLVLMALFPVTAQFVLYSLGKLIFRNTSRPKIFNICIVMNILIWSAVSVWMCFFEEYDNGLAYLVAAAFAVVCAVTIAIMIIYNIIQHKKLKK